MARNGHGLSGWLREVDNLAKLRETHAAREKAMADACTAILEKLGYRVFPPTPGEVPTSLLQGKHPVKCSICKRDFARRLHLGRHMKSTHHRKLQSA